jgi:hypothetical protein
MPTLVAQAASPSIGAWLLSGFGPIVTHGVPFGTAVANILLALVPYARR